MKWGIQRSKVVSWMSKLPACGGVISREYDRFLRLKYKVNSHWARNRNSARLFRNAIPHLAPLQRRLVDELYATGLATCQFDELFNNAELWGRLSAEVKEFSASEEVQSAVRKRQEDFGQQQDFKAVGHYIITKYPEDQQPLITASNLLLNLSVHLRILEVANSYFGLWSKLIYFDVWHTLPLNTNTRFLSQRWHRDPEDRRKIRTFLYFSEVDEEAGAMEYLTGSHVGGPFERVFPWEDPLGIPYPPDGEVERQIPASHRVLLKGSPGTLIFCDTAGFHRGGTSKTKPRIVATAAYVTPASLHGRRYDIDDTVRKAKWGPAQKYAVK